MELADILAIAIILLIGAIVGLVIYKVYSDDRKSAKEKLDRCTVRTEGSLKGFDVKYLRVGFNDDSGTKTYCLRVSYEYGREFYESEFRDTARGWKYLGKVTSLSVLVNPDNPSEIYVPMPTECRAKNRRFIAKVITAIAVWTILGITVKIISE